MPKLSTFKCDQATTGKVLAQSSQSISQLSLLVPQKTSRGAGSAKTTPEEIGLQNHHLIRFVEIFPFGPSQPRYKLQIEAELPGFFHLEEAAQILKSTSVWRWSELHNLGRLGLLVESAIAGTEKLLSKEAE